MMVTVWPNVALKWLFLRLAFLRLARKLASPFGHPTQVSTQLQLAAINGTDVMHVRVKSHISFELPLILSPLLSADVLNTHVNSSLSSRNKWTTRSVKVKVKSKEAALEDLVDLAEGALR